MTESDDLSFRVSFLVKKAWLEGRCYVHLPCACGEEVVFELSQPERDLAVCDCGRVYEKEVVVAFVGWDDE